MMDDTGHIEGSLHREVVATATTYLFVIPHDTQLCLPEFQAIFGDGVAQFLTDLTHVRHRGVSPIAMTHHQAWHLRHMPQIGLGAILREEGTYLIATLPCCLMGSQHATQITRLIDNDLCGEALFLKSLTCLTYQAGYLTVGGRRPLLFGSQPVPVSIRFVDRTEIVKVDAVVRLDALDGCGHKTGKVIVAVVFQIDGAATPCIGSQSILGEIDGSRVKESQEIGHATLLGHAQELTLTSLFRPVVGPISLEEALRARAWVNL